MAGDLSVQRRRGATDSLSIREFSSELGYGVAANAVAAVENPLGTAVVLIEAHPQHLQSLLLARILSALTYGVGQFRKAEVFGLDRTTRALAVALGDLRADGGLPNEMWESAVAAAGAAQLGVKRATPAETALVTAGCREPKA